MNLFPKVKRRLALLAVCLLTLCLPQTAFAAEDIGSITLCYAVQGADFQLYRIGEAGGDEGYVLTGDFAGYAVDLESEDAAQTLAIYAGRDHLPPLDTAVTDQTNSLCFSGLEQGVYLILGEETTVDGVTYTPAPVIVSLPGWENDTLVWDLTVNAKYEEEELPEALELSVLKIWKDSGNESERPAEISVQLLKDGAVSETVVLSEDNNWTHAWTGLDSASVWTVAEQSVPDGYKVSVEKNHTAYVITNTYTTPETPATPQPPSTTTSSKLPQTGQLWWPVSVMACVGVGFLLIGLIRRKKHER